MENNRERNRTNQTRYVYHTVSETYLFVRFLSLENNELVDSENWKRINFDCIHRFCASSHDIQSCDSKWVLMAELMVLAVIQSRCEKFSQTVYQCIWIGNGV